MIGKAKLKCFKHTIPENIGSLTLLQHRHRYKHSFSRLNPQKNLINKRNKDAQDNTVKENMQVPSAS